MVTYTCNKCNKNFKQKCHYQVHINKKFDCSLNNKIIIEPPKNLPEPIIVIQENNNLCCNYCRLVFNRKDNLKRHIDKVCKVKKLQDEEKENIYKILLEKDEEIKKKDEENKKNINKLEENNKELQFNNKNLQKKYKKLEKSYKEIEINNEELFKQIKKLEDNNNKSNIIICNNNKQIEELKSINTINNNLIKYDEFNQDSDDDIESNNLIINDNVIMSRETDKYINGTQLCKASNKKFNDWYRLDNTKELINTLSTNTGIPALELVDKKIGGNHSGTWLHPDLAIQLAQWINPNLALHVSKWIRTLFSSGKVNLKLIKKQEEKINRSTKKIKELENMVLKKQKREIYPELNVIYMLTTQDHKKRNTYIIGKATNLTDRLSTYNKTCDHEVVYYKECKNEEHMDLSEKIILLMLDEYREVINRDRFILPKGKDNKFFIDIINKYI